MAALNNVDDSNLQVLAERGAIRYFKHKELGRGTFGSVYEGIIQGEKIAVKKILRDRYTEIEEELLRTIRHRHILRYLDIVKTEDLVYIAMELCAGTLEDLIRNKYEGPKPGPMEELLLQTALGLEFLHEKSIIHRDIKPMNILISMASFKDGKKPVMKLADFGLCKQRTDGGTSFSNSTNGTPGWAAPESMVTDDYDEMMRTDDVKKIRFSADIFSLGCVFGYALTGGCHPFGDNYLRMYYCLNIWKYQPALDIELLKALKTCVDEQYDLNSTDEDERNCVVLMLRQERWKYEDGEELDRFQKEYLKIFLSDAGIPLVDIKHKDRSGRNVLHYLCEYYKGDDITQFARIFIDRGINVNKTSSDLFPTPLHLACRNVQNGNLIKLLLERGAKVDICSTIFLTNPLHELVSNYKGTDICDVMQLLINAGADFNARNSSDRNVLLDLCYCNSSHPMLREAIAILIKNGVDVNHVDKWRSNALTYICFEKQDTNTHGVIKLLLENGITAQSQCWAVYNALLVLCENYKGGDLVDVMQTLVEHGADINSKTEWGGKNALHLVCEKYENPRLRDVIEFLIEKGIDINHVDENNGWNGLTIICSRNQDENTHEVVKLLLKNNINVKAKALTGFDALLSLCKNYKGGDLVEILKTLVENGADINSKTKWDQNALQLVCESYKNPRLRDVIEFLIEKGIDPKAKNKSGIDATYYLKNRRPASIDPLDCLGLEEI